MTAKLSDLRVREEVLGHFGQPIVSHKPLPLPELLAMLEAEGVLRREDGEPAWGQYSDEWRYVSDWQPREESSDESGRTS